MSFAGLLGAGLLGGAGNAAKGIGDRLREEAKQKRLIALQDRADERADKVAKTANDNAVDAARERRVFDAREGRLNRHQQSQMQIGAGNIAATAATVADGRGVVNEATATDVAADVAVVKNNNVVTNAATATDVAQTVALTQAEVNAEAAKQLAIVNKKRASQLSVVQMEQLTANNAAALARIKAGKVGDVHTFFDEVKGLEYKGVTQEDGTFKMEGGTKAATSASQGSLKLQNIKLDGKNVAGYMDGKTWVTVGGAVDTDSADGNGWNAKKATDYFRKEVYDQYGIKVSDLGVILGDVDKTDFKTARRLIAAASERYIETGEEPSVIAAEVFSDNYQALKPATSGVIASANKMIDNGISKAAIKKEIEAKGFDSSFLD